MRYVRPQAWALMAAVRLSAARSAVARALRPRPQFPLRPSSAARQPKAATRRIGGIEGIGQRARGAARADSLARGKTQCSDPWASFLLSENRGGDFEVSRIPRQARQTPG